MWLARSKALAWALVLLVGSTAGALALAQRPKEAAQPEVPGAQAVGAAPPAVKGGRVTDTRPKVSRVLPVAEGGVTSVAFGPDGRFAAGYAGFDAHGQVGPGGVVVFDARGERLRPAPLAVKEGQVSGVAFGPEGRIAAGYYDSSVCEGGGTPCRASWSSPSWPSSPAPPAPRPSPAGPSSRRISSRGSSTCPTASPARTSSAAS
jgi:hypothetical protein